MNDNQVQAVTKTSSHKYLHKNRNNEVENRESQFFSATAVHFMSTVRYYLKQH